MPSQKIPPEIEKLLTRIADRNYTIGIVGLGYVGLPLALTAVQQGFDVLGFDINEARVADLNEGRSGIEHIDDEMIAAAASAGKFWATADFSELGKPDAILIAVPTPLSKQREPDLVYVERSAEAIAQCLRKGQLIVLESTTWPGTTKELVKPILEKTGLVCGEDFFLAYSPEREDPGNTEFHTRSIPKIVGADDDSSRELVGAIYGTLVSEVVPVVSAATAEAVKLTENIFRSVNIALVNELKLIYDKMDIDIWEVIDAAKTKPFGFMPFYPGPGLGGHCIPIDPFYLTWKAREYEVAARFIELAGEINTAMPHHVVNKLASALDCSFSRGLNGSKILVIGMAYKKNVDDMRESPSLKLIDLLVERSANVEYHDPHIAEVLQTRSYPQMRGMKSLDLTPQNLQSFDAVLISTDHDAIDWATIVEHSRLIVDSRNVCNRNGFFDSKIHKA
ncbi:nucleotide sugar dehydrogenase [Roseibium album]|uniref:nucleotide sugar dehydrogenase n=1 Tax=Roseibium album TaxID=311410 RepID=UPI002491A67E|nr:nucleotide sugar dehydrogenase [Roseibium album]